MKGERFNPYTYLAVGERPTSLYTFDLLTGQLRPTKTRTHRNGFDALAYRWKDGLLYAMDRATGTLLAIDPEKGVVNPRKTVGLPLPRNYWALGAMAPDGDHYVITSADADDKGAVLDLSADPITVKETSPPGDGGWYDWAFHPVDERLYAVDGQTGALLYADPSKTPQKTVLAAGVFPKAQAGNAGYATYSALFFDSAGWLYAIDNAGNVYKTDLTASTRGHLISGSDAKPAERVGRVPVAARDLDIRDAAGDVGTPKVSPQYEEIPVRQVLRRKPWEQWDASGPVLVSSFRVTLTADSTAVRKWRVFFDAVKNAKVITQAANVSVSEVDGHFVLDTPGEDHLINQGSSLDVDLQVIIPKSGKADLPELPNLGARRID